MLSWLGLSPPKIFVSDKLLSHSKSQIRSVFMHLSYHFILMTGRPRRKKKWRDIAHILTPTWHVLWQVSSSLSMLVISLTLRFSFFSVSHLSNLEYLLVILLRYVAEEDIGENGTGKTTMISMLGGYIKPDKEVDLPELHVSFKPQKISPKFEGTVRMLLMKKVIYYHCLQCCNDTKTDPRSFHPPSIPDWCLQTSSHWGYHRSGGHYFIFIQIFIFI